MFLTNRIRIKEKRRLLYTTLIGFFLIFPLFLGFQLYRLTTNSIFDGFNQINIILDIGEVFLVAYRPVKKSLTILQIPRNLYVNVSYSFGEYEIKNVFELAKLKKEIKGLTPELLLRKTLMSNFYFPIDGWVKIDIPLPQNFRLRSKAVREIIKAHTGFPGLIPILKTLNSKKIKTNLTFWDLLRLSFSLKDLYEDRISIFELGDFGVIETRKGEGGETIKILRKERLTPFIAKLFSNERIQNEALTVSIINATGKVGIANEVANLISAIGGTIIGREKTEETVPYSLCQIKESGISRSYTLKKIRKILNLNCRLDKTSSEERSDITLILGRDYY